VMVSTVWSVSCLQPSTHDATRGQPFVKVGEHVPPCPIESAPLYKSIRYFYVSYILRLISFYCVIATLFRTLPL